MKFVVFYLLCLTWSVLPTPSAEERSLRYTSAGNTKTNERYGILGGKETTIDKYPHLVSITYTPDNFIIGAGSILSKEWIICSAYEIKGYSLQEMVVRAGSSRPKTGGQLLTISKIIMYDKFYGGYPDDFALIKTTVPITIGKLSKPIKLSKVTPEVGTNVQVVGFGLSSRKAQSNYSLKVATVEIKSTEECTQQHGDLGETCLCADADGVGPCYADMGASLVYKKQLLGYYLGGDGCNYYNILEIYSHIIPVRKWILDTIKNNSV